MGEVIFAYLAMGGMAYCFWAWNQHESYHEQGGVFFCTEAQVSILFSFGKLDVWESQVTVVSCLDGIFFYFPEYGSQYDTKPRSSICVCGLDGWTWGRETYLMAA